jgi:hypothetical protein
LPSCAAHQYGIARAEAAAQAIAPCSCLSAAVAAIGIERIGWRADMLNVWKLGELDFSTIDMRSLTPEEREAVRGEAYRRARAERNKAMRELVGCLRSWWQSRKLERSGLSKATR